MDSELIEALQCYLAGTANRQTLDALVASYNIWNKAQDGEPEIEALRGPVGALEVMLVDVSEGNCEESALRELAQSLLSEQAPKQSRATLHSAP